jgi:hypothetical protein
MKIFISHTSRDSGLAVSLVDLLISSLVLEDSDIRCTSAPGHKLPIGIDFAQTLRGEVANAPTVVGLITNEAIKSAWVLFELGATWGAQRPLLPLIHPTVDLAILPGPLTSQNCARMGSHSDILQFLDELSLTTQSTKRNAPRIDSAVKRFLFELSQVDADSTSNTGRKSTESLKQTENINPSALLSGAYTGDRPKILKDSIGSLQTVSPEEIITTLELLYTGDRLSALELMLGILEKPFDSNKTQHVLGQLYTSDRKRGAIAIAKATARRSSEA